MGWSEAFSSVYRYAFDTTTSGMVSSIYWGGRLASLAGGVLSSVSFALDEQMTAGYYASANTSGMVHLNLTATTFGYSVQEQFPFAQPEHSQGAFADNLDDYIHPWTMQMIALGLASGGILLQSIGAGADLMLSSYQVRDHYQRTQQLSIPMPGRKEYAAAIAAASLHAVTMTAGASALTTCFLRFSGTVTREYQFTHPAHSSEHIVSKHYSGPVTQKNITFTDDVVRLVNVTISGYTLPVRIDALINATAHAQYGAGVKFDSGGVDSINILPTSMVAGSAYIMGSFFGQKQSVYQNDRMLKASERQETDETCRLIN